jgi:hypothetical protein
MILTLTLFLLMHEWYSDSCCGSRDCHPVACDQLVEDATGWVYLPKGTHFSPTQIFPSQDRHCHVCITAPNSETPMAIPHCAYIQQGT